MNYFERVSGQKYYDDLVNLQGCVSSGKLFKVCGWLLLGLGVPAMLIKLLTTSSVGSNVISLVFFTFMGIYALTMGKQMLSTVQKLIGMIDDDMKNRRYESRTIIISAVTMDNMNKYFDVSKSNTMTSFDAFYIIKDVQGNLYKCNGIPPHNFGALNGMQLNITYLVGSRVIDSVQVI